MFTAIVSSLTNIPIHKDVAMTGEITLRGRVLPIGGLKEKLLAAVRGGIKKVILPKDNKKDLIEIEEKDIVEKLDIHFVDSAEDVLKIALTSKVVPIKWVENEISISKDRVSDEQTQLTH